MHENGYLGDGDARYRASELVSNLPEEKLEAIGVLAAGGPAGEPDSEMADRLRDAARDPGQVFGNFDEWYDGLPFDPDQKKKRMKDLRNAYGGGRGRFDGLRPWTQAVIVDDDVVPSLLNLADNRIMSPYSRGSNNLWTGGYFIVTSNMSFDEWAAERGVRTSQLAAARDRFYICAIVGEGKSRRLGMESESHRGSKPVELERLAMFRAFQEKFDHALSSYNPEASIDYEYYKDPAFRKDGALQGVDSGAFWEVAGQFCAFFWRESGLQPYDRKMEMEYLRQLTDRSNRF